MALALPRKAGSLFSTVLRELDSRVCVRMKLDPYPSVCAKKKKKLSANGSKILI